MLAEERYGYFPSSKSIVKNFTSLFDEWFFISMCIKQSSLIVYRLFEIGFLMACSSVRSIDHFNIFIIENFKVK